MKNIKIDILIKKKWLLNYDSIASVFCLFIYLYMSVSKPCFREVTSCRQALMFPAVSQTQLPLASMFDFCLARAVLTLPVIGRPEPTAAWHGTLVTSGEVLCARRCRCWRSDQRQEAARVQVVSLSWTAFDGKNNTRIQRVIQLSISLENTCYYWTIFLELVKVLRKFSGSTKLL